MPRGIALSMLSLILVFVVSGCQFLQPPQPTQTMSGTLHSVRPVGGGDPTGWVLSMGSGGFEAGSMALDVSKVKEQAMALDGKQVTIEMRPGNDGKMHVESFGILSPTAK